MLENAPEDGLMGFTLLECGRAQMHLEMKQLNMKQKLNNMLQFLFNTF